MQPIGAVVDCQHLGRPLGIAHPSVMIVETSDTTDLGFISDYYDGFLDVQPPPPTMTTGSDEPNERLRASLR